MWSNALIVFLLTRAPHFESKSVKTSILNSASTDRSAGEALIAAAINAEHNSSEIAALTLRTRDEGSTVIGRWTMSLTTLEAPNEHFTWAMWARTVASDWLDPSENANTFVVEADVRTNPKRVTNFKRTSQLHIIYLLVVT